MAIETIPGAAAGDLTTLLGTTGADTIETSATETKDLFIDALAGADTITVTEGVTGIRVEGDEDADTITFEGFVLNTAKDSAQRIQGGQANDTITFQGEVEDALIRGGRGDDSIKFSSTATDLEVDGDTGADTLDFDGKVFSTTINGGTENDNIDLADRIEDSTVKGGEGDDTITTAGIGDAAFLDGGVGEDEITIAGDKIQSATIKGSAGLDTITFGADATVSTGSVTVYAGKDDDTVVINSLVKNVTVNLDKGDDVIDFDNDGSATIYGGDGDDEVKQTATTADANKFFFNGNAGDDTVLGGGGKDTVFGGQGDDVIDGVAGDDSLFGSKGADTIYAGSGEDVIGGGADDDVIFGRLKGGTTTDGDKMTIYGGAGDDQITVGDDTEATDALAYTITGGAGEDTISVEDLGEGAAAEPIALLKYANFAEFYASGDTVDVITVNDAQGEIVKFEIGGAIKLDSADEMDNFTATNGEHPCDAESALRRIFSMKPLQRNSTLSTGAGTTGSSKIDVSDANAGFTIKGGAGRNTLTGSGGADTITGGKDKDTVTGEAGADNILLVMVLTVAFDETGAGNGDDVVTDLVVGTSGDVLDVSAFTSTAGTALRSTTPLTAAKTTVGDADLLGAGEINNEVVLLKGTVADYDAAAEVADLFTVAGDANGTLGGALGVGEKAVLIIGANDGTELSLAFVDNAAGAAIADTEVTMVGSYTGATADAIDKFVAGNFEMN